ncbi:hypothetical protein LTR09_004053 [Extremus antarcticus]|uniref:Uncharacterized protein n=1 Tax=Extremus antarcticus TaxID=702011 RepID=A0AAJ0DIT6_9PEZI|nr:hypothetical protein LTR09_004053 [Extremus antarcticus]
MGTPKKPKEHDVTRLRSRLNLDEPSANTGQSLSPATMSRRDTHLTSPPAANDALISRETTYDEQMQSQLLRLPREVRDMILEHLIVQEKAIYTNRLSKWVSKERDTVDNWLALSLTCRQLHNEAHKVFFTQNCFAFEVKTGKIVSRRQGTTRTARPLPQIPAHQMRFIRRFELYRWRYCAETRLVCCVKSGDLETKVVCEGQIVPGGRPDTQENIEKELLRAAHPVVEVLKEAMRDGKGLTVDVLCAGAAKLLEQWPIQEQSS